MTSTQRSIALDAEQGSELYLLPRAREARPTLYVRFGKRALDLVIGVPLLVAALPAIVLLAAVVVATSGWPPFYRSRRVGRGGREFGMWKLRTMVRDAEAQIRSWRESDPSLLAEYSHNFKVRDDPRVTAFGRWLRRTSLDELPQLWNVVKGDMSLVGPRPIVADELRHYGREASTLLSVRPGITGMWQLNGRGRISYPERTLLELDCCQSLGLRRDLSMLVRTLTAPFRFDGL